MSRRAHPTETDDASSDESTEVDHDAETPVNAVRLADGSPSEGSIRTFIVEECVLCGETHRHGSMDPVAANGGRSHRAAHCHGIDHTGGYYLELAEDADPPDRWYSWVDSESGMEVSRP